MILEAAPDAILVIADAGHLERHLPIALACRDLGLPVVLAANLADGKELWSERVSKGKGAFWASPIAGDGKIYTFDDAGICTVLKAGDTASVLASNDLKEEIMGTPALANGSIYIRTVAGLYCISQKK